LAADKAVSGIPSENQSAANVTSIQEKE